MSKVHWAETHRRQLSMPYHLKKENILLSLSRCSMRPSPVVGSVRGTKATDDGCDFASPFSSGPHPHMGPAVHKRITFLSSEEQLMRYSFLSVVYIYICLIGRHRISFGLRFLSERQGALLCSGEGAVSICHLIPGCGHWRRPNSSL